MNVKDELLTSTIAMKLDELERAGEVVVIASSARPLAKQIAEAVLSVVPNTSLSHLEMVGIRRLVLHAISDSRFFDWEMPTLTGFEATEFALIAEKLPRD